MGAAFSVQGINMGGWSSLSLSLPEAIETLQTLKAEHHVNSIILSIPLEQDSLTATTVKEVHVNDFANTPSDEALTGFISAARGLGIDVQIKPVLHIGPDGHPDHMSWNDLNPSDPKAWFESYKAKLVHLADIAQKAGSKVFFIGNELESLTTNPAFLPYWEDIIATLRAHFTGELGYNAGAAMGDRPRGAQDIGLGGVSWEEYRDVTFWHLLDRVGLSFYPELSADPAADRQDFVAGWRNNRYGRDIIQEFQTFSQQIGKKLYLTELGSFAWDGGNSNFNFNPQPGRFDLEEHTDFFAATFQVLAGQSSWLAGVYPYSVYPNIIMQPSNGDTNYALELEGKPATDLVKFWYSRSASSRDLFGTDASETLKGSREADTIASYGGNDKVYGFNGADLLESGAGSDTVFGGNGNDFLELGAGNDFGYGDAGNDKLKGGSGADRLFGGTGNDTLDGGAQNDTLDGGAGKDTVSAEFAQSGVTIDLALKRVKAKDGNDKLVSIENARRSNFNDKITGDAGSNTLVGLFGNDTLKGLGGNDTLKGGARDDKLNGGDGNDRLFGGSGNDLLTGGKGKDTFVFDLPAYSNDQGNYNVDYITDFKGVDDAIALSRSAFTGFSRKGTISKGAFHLGSAAHDANDRIIYSKSDGRIFYDPDGTGPAQAHNFASVNPGTKITYLDFIVI